MATGSITFSDMPARYTMVAKQNMIMFFLQKWFYIFCQCMNVIGFVVKWCKKFQFKSILILLMNFFGRFNGCFKTRHGIMRIQGNCQHFFQVWVIFLQLIKSSFGCWVTIAHSYCHRFINF